MADQFSDFLKQNSPTPGNGEPNPGVPASATPTPPGGGDAFSQFLASQSNQGPAPAASAPASPISQPQAGGGDAFAQFLSSNGNATASAETPRPVSGTGEHDESDRFTQEDPGDNWLQKSWSFLNKPLTESLFGWGQYRQGAGGLERGVEKIASGLTAPLSLGLLAAFAPAGIAEGVAGSALKEGLTEGGTLLGEEALDGISAASKVERYGQAVDAAQKAKVAGTSIQSAVESKGLPYQEFLNMGQYLRNQGMQETDVLGESLARRVASQGLRKAGISDAKALVVAKGAETLVNAGFGVQQLHGAIYAYPRMMDLLSQGDYDDAAEYMVEAGAGTIFGGLGVAHGLTSIHDILPGVNEKENLPLSEEVENIKKAFGSMAGDITSSQTQIAARARAHLADLMETAGVPVPAGLRERVPFLSEDSVRLKELTESPRPLQEAESKELTDLQAKKDLSDLRASQTGFGAEITSAIQGILSNKDQREKLLQKQKEFFVRLDSGNDRNAMYQKGRALTAAYNLDDWLQEESKSRGWNFVPPERTLEDIANEETNGVLSVKTAARGNQDKISGLNDDLKLATSDLRSANAEEAPGIQQKIDALKDQINDAQLEQEKLDQKYKEAQAWEDPSRREEAFQKLYQDHIDDIKSAADSTPWDSPNAKELFYEKVRALGNYPQDLSLIEKEYPHFRDRGNIAEATSGFSSRSYLYNPEYYTDRLQNPELVQKSMPVETPHGSAIAVPVGGNRLAGSLDYTYSPDELAEADRAIQELKTQPEDFPNPRVEKTGRGSYEVRWGEDVNAPLPKDTIVSKLGSLRSNANTNFHLTQDKVAYDLDELEHARTQIKYYQKAIEDLPEGDPNDQLETFTSVLGRLRAEEEVAKRSYDISQERYEKAERIFEQANKRYKDAQAGNIPKDLSFAPAERAQLLGDLYGYKPQQVSEFIDENKNYFTGPQIEAAKEFTKLKTFKNWFRSSKVTDENNDPLVVFHGTGSDWTKFDPKMAVKGKSLGFHAGSLSQAQDFVRGAGTYSSSSFNREGGRIMPVFLSIQNPLRVTDFGTWAPERTAASLTKYGITDKTTVSVKPKGMGLAEWDNLTAAQQKLITYTDKEVERQIAEGQMQPITSDSPFVDKQKYLDRRAEIANDYVIGLLEDNGYDGLVYKNVAEGEKTTGPKGGDPTSGDSYIALHPSQIKSAVGNSGEFSPEKEDILEKTVFSTAPGNNDVKSLGKQIEKLREEGVKDGDPRYENLLKKINNLENDHIGEVHELPSGKKIAYLTPRGFQRLYGLSTTSNVPDGAVMSRPQVDDMLSKLKGSTKYSPEVKKNLEDIITKGRNKDGELILAAIKQQGSNRLSDRLWTLREELVHAWQHSLSNFWIDHVDNAGDLHSSMPKELKDHLNVSGYGNRSAHMKVIEGAAKLMAVLPEQTMLPRAEWREYDTLRQRLKSGVALTDENFERLKQLQNKVIDVRTKAQGWLNKYFQAIKDKYGDKAFDQLTHTTNLARRWNKEFTDANRTGAGQNEEAVGGVGAEPAGTSAGVGGGGPGGPPRPPAPSSEEDFNWRKFFGPESGGTLSDQFPTEYWQTGPQHPSLPANLVEQVNKAKARVHTPEQLEYVKSMIHAYMAGAQGISDSDAALYKKLRQADDDNWTAGYNNGIIHSIVPNHIHHMWGDDPKKGYPEESEARSGAFAINATQARHRSWSTALEGLLQGRQLAVHDPTSLIAHDAHEIAEASGHRKALDVLKRANIKDPEGMPAFVYRGAGRVVPSEDGTKASILVNPNVVKNILMDPTDVQRLTKSGLLDTYLRDARVKDITPQVGQGNVQEWLTATQKKLDKLGESNPLLNTVKDRQMHEAGWANLKTFAQSQAQNISEYLSDALKQIKEQTPDAKGRYTPLSEADKPDHINMAKYLGDVLHGKNKYITSADLERLEDYAERNRNYAQGLSGDGHTEIRPHEVARLVGQEKDHISPELKEYLDKHHDIFAPRDEQGNWTRKGLNTTIYHIAHAAENKEFPQLVQDLLDLKKVNNMYTSVNPISQALHKDEATKILKDINDRQPKQYVWAPKSHITIDHPSFHGYKWMASAADGTPTLAESDMAVSRHFYHYVINRLGLKPSWLREKEGLGKITEPLLKAGAQVKSTILSGSPFHVIQIALRGLMLHVNPFIRPNPISDINEPFEYSPGKTSTLRKGVENSLTLFTDKNAAEDHSVGVASHGGLVSKIPIYGPFTDQIHDFLFNRFIPSVKADSYKQMYKQYADAHPDWTEDAIAYRAAQHTNNAFGGVNWREMGRSATTQDWFNLVALAPDWLESEMRFAAGLFNGYGIGPGKYQREEGKNFTRIQVAQAAVALWTIARVTNQLYSGNPHYESPFGLIVKDKEGRDIEYSVRTMPTDILHAATDPYGFLVGRTSPLLRTSQELVTGRNQYGQKLSDSEKYVDLLSNLSPIWGQAGFKKATKLSTAADVGGVQQLVKAAGATAQVYRTPAEKTAANLAAERSEGGAINPAQISRHRLLIQLEENVRSQKITAHDLQNMVDQGQLPEADAKDVIKVARETTGLDPEQARLYSRTSRLDWQGAYSVWEDANPTEKAMLHNLIMKKARSYIRKSLQDETPDTRSVDPMFKIARRYAPIVPEPETVNQ